MVQVVPVNVSLQENLNNALHLMIVVCGRYALQILILDVAFVYLVKPLVRIIFTSWEIPPLGEGVTPCEVDHCQTILHPATGVHWIRVPMTSCARVGDPAFSFAMSRTCQKVSFPVRERTSSAFV